MGQNGRPKWLKVSGHILTNSKWTILKSKSIRPREWKVNLLAPFDRPLFTLVIDVHYCSDDDSLSSKRVIRMTVQFGSLPSAVVHFHPFGTVHFWPDSSGRQVRNKVDGSNEGKWTIADSLEPNWTVVRAKVDGQWPKWKVSWIKSGRPNGAIRSTFHSLGRIHFDLRIVHFESVKMWPPTFNR